MKPPILRLLILVAIGGLSVGVASAGMARTEIENAIPMSSRELLGLVSKKGANVQVVDVRVLADDDDDVGGYQDARVPGSLPMPGCDPDKVPEQALGRVRADIPTVLVSRDGDAATFERCRKHFLRVRNLEGGMAAWSEAGLPEEDGPYVAPKPGAGGGCL
ncbi:MAG: hypothetical protein RIT45_2914 [Pseudomonadota bacterium]|jgi:rhodanese-related sulfurtransferase